MRQLLSLLFIFVGFIGFCQSFKLINVPLRKGMETMAHKTGAGSTRNNRDSHSKRLGWKCCHNQHMHSGCILLRQRGMTFKPGFNVGYGRDYTLFALADGIVKIKRNEVSVIKPGEEIYL